MLVSTRAMMLAALAGILLSASTVGAQQPTPGASQSVRRPSTGAMIAGGILGGVTGLFAGAALGSAIDRARGYDQSCNACIRWGAAAGAGVGTTLGIALGVHAFNDGRGQFRPVVLRTTAVIGVTWAASYAASRLAPEGVDMLVVITGIGAGVYTAVRTERATTVR